MLKRHDRALKILRKKNMSAKKMSETQITDFWNLELQCNFLHALLLRIIMSVLLRLFHELSLERHVDPKGGARVHVKRHGPASPTKVTSGILSSGSHVFL